MKRTKIGWMAMMAVLAGAWVVAPVVAADAPADKQKKDEPAAEADTGAPALLTLGDLAQVLVRKLGLLGQLGTATPTAIQCIDMLTRFNIVPSVTLTPGGDAAAQGWSDVAAPVEPKTLAIVLVRALGLTDEVSKNGDVSNPDSWVKVLDNVQVPYDTVGAGVSQLMPVSEVIAAIPVRASTPEPLDKVYIPASGGLGIIEAIAQTGTMFPDLSSPQVSQTMVENADNAPPPKKQLTSNTSNPNNNAEI